jgi:hypothetical protein
LTGASGLGRDQSQAVINAILNPWKVAILLATLELAASLEVSCLVSTQVTANIRIALTFTTNELQASELFLKKTTSSQLVKDFK